MVLRLSAGSHSECSRVTLLNFGDTIPAELLKGYRHVPQLVEEVDQVWLSKLRISPYLGHSVTIDRYEAV